MALTHRCSRRPLRGAAELGRSPLTVAKVEKKDV